MSEPLIYRRLFQIKTHRDREDATDAKEIHTHTLLSQISKGENSEFIKTYVIKKSTFLAFLPARIFNVII